MATESDASGLGSLRPIIIAGLTGIGLGIGGNYAAPERPHTHPEFDELDRRRAEAIVLLDRMQSDIIELLKNDIKRDTLTKYWMQELEKLKQLHSPGQHPHMSNPAR